MYNDSSRSSPRQQVDYCIMSMAPSRGCQLILARRLYVCPRCQSRSFATTTSIFSGHSRWSKIKHDKGKADAAKNRQRSQFAQEIASASKLYGPDPGSNPRLADVIVKAKREGFAKASIEAAIARGQGKGIAGEKLESVTVEGMLPGNVGVVVECETDNKARTMTGLKLALKEAGGTATSSAYLFERKGRVIFETKRGKGLGEVLDAALDAGATDVEEQEDNQVTVLCEPEDTVAIGQAVSKALGLRIASSEIIWQPIKDTVVALDNQEVADELGAFVDELYEHEPSMNVAMNIAPGSLSDDAWRDLQGRMRV